MALQRRLQRIIRENTLRYVGIFILIMLGSYTFVLAAGLSRNLETLATAFIEEHWQEDLSFTTNRPLADIVNLEHAAGAVIEEYRILDAQVTEVLTLRLITETKKVNTPAVVAGRPLSGPNEILIDPAFAAANGYDLGSHIEAAGRTFTVTGFMSLPHYIYPVPNVYDIIYTPESFGVGVIDRDDFAGLETGHVESFYATRFIDRSESINRQAVQLRELIADRGIAVSDWIDVTSNRRANLIWASITGLKTMSIPLPAAMFLLGCLITGMMIWRMVRHEAVIIGTLYAQGYRRGELSAHYMAIPLLLALGGGVAGSLLALPSIKPSVMAMVTYYNIPVTGIELSALNALIGILTPVLFLGLSSYLVIHSELKRSPVELMKGRKLETSMNALERALKLARFKFSTRFKLREQMRSISRVLFLLLGVTSASVLMLFGFTIMNSMNQVFQSGITDTYQFEYEYTFRGLQYGRAPEGAEIFTAGRFYPAEHERIEFYVTGIEPDSSGIVVRDVKGNILPNDQTNITKPLADRLGVGAGDSVSLINKQDGKTYTFHLDAVAAAYAEQFIFMPINQYNALLGLPENSYMGLFSNRQLDFPAGLLSGTKTMSDIPSAMDELMGPMIAMIVLMTLVASVVALIIIYLVTSLLIEESKNTISLLKIFGYKSREIDALVLDSSTPLIIAGFIIAIPVALASFSAVYGYLGEMINFVLPTTLSPLYVAVCFVVVMLTYQLSKKLSARRISTITMSEALKAGTE